MVNVHSVQVVVAVVYIGDLCAWYASALLFAMCSEGIYIYYIVLELAIASLLTLRACAERVTVVVLCVCMSVTHTLFWQYARLKV